MDFGMDMLRLNDSMILINNNQTDIPLDLLNIQKDVERILTFLEYQNFDLGIMFTDNTTIQSYNRDYRNKDTPTDILSFPYHADLQAGEQIQPQTSDDKNLGDIIMSPHYIHADLDRWNMNFDKRMRMLLVHGICHLLGYDHIHDKDYEVMKKEEERILHHLKEPS